jgi:hypothetical protein
VAPDGRFDGDLRGEELPLHWTLDDDPNRPLGLALFMQDFYTPRLLSAAMAGDDRPASLSLATLNRAQPKVGIASLEMHKAPDTVSVNIEVEESSYRNQNSGAHDLRVLFDDRVVAERSGPIGLDAAGRASVVLEGITLPRGKDRLIVSAYAFNASGVRSELARRAITIPLTPVAERRAYILAIGVNEVPRLPNLRDASPLCSRHRCRRPPRPHPPRGPGPPARAVSACRERSRPLCSSTSSIRPPRTSF